MQATRGVRYTDSQLHENTELGKDNNNNKKAIYKRGAAKFSA